MKLISKHKGFFQSGHRSPLKWKIFALIACLMVVLAAVAAGLSYKSLKKSVTTVEIDRIKFGARGLIEVGENYYMGSVTIQACASAVEKFCAEHRLAFVLFAENGEKLLAGASKSADVEKIFQELKSTGKKASSGPVEFTINGQPWSVIVERTDTDPPYFLYIGVDSKIINKKVASAFSAGPLMIFPLLIILLLLSLIGCFLLFRPYEALVKKVERLSLGDLDVPLDLSSEDELGSLSRSFDRMRESVRYALDRLNRDS